MKTLTFVISCLTCILLANSFLYSNTVIGNLQNKKNNFNKQGITYSVSIENEQNSTSIIKCILTEKDKNKFFETLTSYTKTNYLLCDDKLYQVQVSTSFTAAPKLLLREDKSYQIQGNPNLYSLKFILCPEEMKKNILDEYYYEIPDYADCIVGDKITVNGYSCQILTKTITETIKNEQNFTTRQNITKMYITERYGYPTKIEYLYKNSYSNSADYDEGFSRATVNFTNFNTDVTNKLLELPENPFIIDYKKD